MPSDSFITLIIGALILLALFFFTWRLSVRLENYSFVDVTWALSFTPLSIWYAVAGGGWMPRRIAIATLVSLWSLRLGIYLWRRVASHHPKEDVRYAVLRKKWSANLHRAFFWFFHSQAVLVWLLMLPVFLICRQTNTAFHWLEYTGLAVWFIALVGEGISDAQLARFKATNNDPKAICQIGLWHYSRHPNYFFQSLLWWGLFLMALPAPWGWLAIIAPLAMLHFLLNVTGIPLTEKLSVEKRGDVYREYQRTTSAFVPWFRKPSS
jgi:steroid 5-alpha reductase family enzyme